MRINKLEDPLLGTRVTQVSLAEYRALQHMLRTRTEEVARGRVEISQYLDSRAKEIELGREEHRKIVEFMHKFLTLKCLRTKTGRELTKIAKYYARDSR